VVRVEARAGEGVGERAGGPSAADVAANIEATPSKGPSVNN
jgi:hypothetical protein